MITVPYFVCISDGDAQHAAGLGEAIKGEFEVATCQLARQVLDRLHSARPPDLLIIDFDIPDMDCFTFLSVLPER